MKVVLIPKENEKDLKEIKPEVKEGLQIVPVNTIAEAMPYVFSNFKTKRSSKTTKKNKK
jgi:ATP-dependent Lon protease